MTLIPPARIMLALVKLFSFTSEFSFTLDDFTCTVYVFVAPGDCIIDDFALIAWQGGLVFAWGMLVFSHIRLVFAHIRLDFSHIRIDFTHDLMLLTLGMILLTSGLFLLLSGLFLFP